MSLTSGGDSAPPGSPTPPPLAYTLVLYRTTATTTVPDIVVALHAILLVWVLGRSTGSTMQGSSDLVLKSFKSFAWLAGYIAISSINTWVTLTTFIGCLSYFSVTKKCYQI